MCVCVCVRVYTKTKKSCDEGSVVVCMVVASVKVGKSQNAGRKRMEECIMGWFLYVELWDLFKRYQRVRSCQ